MKNRIAIILGCVALAFIAQAVLATDAPSAKAPAKSMVTGKKSMTEKGSFHRIHAKKGKLECVDCHEEEPLAENTVKLRLHDTLPKGSPGPVKHEGCFTCHKDKLPLAKYKN
jgi:hypothetical protein